MGKSKMPQPLWNDVLIANPMADRAKTEEIEKTAKKLPQAERDEFVREHLASIWENVEILAVGSECRQLKTGDHVCGTPEAVTGGSPTPDGNYLFINERAFRGRW